MTKQEILDEFNDINFVYNDSTKHETLSRMLDELLKEQEPVAPYVDSEGIINCGNCGTAVGYYPAGSSTPDKGCKYCPECGRKVNWNATD